MIVVLGQNRYYFPDRTSGMLAVIRALIVSHLMLWCVGGRVGQYFITVPRDVVFKSGEDLKLPCTVGNKQGACQWTKDGFGMGVDPSLPGFPRFSMGVDAESDCSLNIYSVQPLVNKSAI